MGAYRSLGSGGSPIWKSHGQSPRLVSQRWIEDHLETTVISGFAELVSKLPKVNFEERKMFVTKLTELVVWGCECIRVRAKGKLKSESCEVVSVSPGGEIVCR